MPSLVRHALVAAALLGIAACRDAPTEPVRPTDVTLKLCGPAPVWVGFQDGNAAWTEVERGSDGASHAYKFTMTARIGAVTVVDTLPVGTVNWVVYGTAAELAQLHPGTKCESGLKTITGTITGGFAHLISRVTLGGASAHVLNESGSFTLSGVAPGPQDLIAARGSSFGRDRVIVRRGLDLPNNAVLPLLDFNSSEAITLDSATVSIDQFPNLSGFVSSWIRTATSGWAPGSTSPASATTRYRGLPASATVSGDVHLISVDVMGRYVDRYVGPIANVTVSLGPVAATPTVTTLSSATPGRMRVTMPVQPAYPRMATVEFQAGSNPRRIVRLTTTEGYRGTADMWILEVPDFGSTSGYNAAWGLPGGAARSWRSEVYDWDFLANLSPTPGLTNRKASKIGTVGATAAVTIHYPVR